MNRIKIIKFIAKLIVVIGLLVSQASHAAIFIKIPGVEGSSKDNHHKDNHHKEWIEILAVSSVNFNAVSTDDWSLPGNLDQKSVVIKKTIDKSSSKLQQALQEGSNFYSEVEIHLLPNIAAGRQPYYRIKMKNVFIISYSVSGSAQGKGEPVPVEELTLNFEEIKVSFVTEPR